VKRVGGKGKRRDLFLILETNKDRKRVVAYQKLIRMLIWLQAGKFGRLEM
jgi:hypothetical protein